MLNLKKVLMAVFVVANLMCFCSVAASAQLYRPGDAWDKGWRNHPCSEPEISWVLTTVEGHATAGVDCNPSNYPGYKSVRSESQMMQILADYRAFMRRQSATVSPLFVAGNGHTLQTISKNGVPVFDVDYGKILGNSSSGVVGPAGGSLITDNGGAIVATGAGNIISHDAGSIVATGAGNFYGGLSVGDTVVQFPGRWVKASKAAAAPQPAGQPAACSGKPNPSAQETQQWRQRGPCTDPWVSKAVTEYKGSVNGAAGYGDCNTRQYNGGSWGSCYSALYTAVAAALSHPAAPPRDDAVLICVSPTVNQIRSADNGANHLTSAVSGGVARFSGNVLTQTYKDTLSAKATACGARPDVSSLRVGR